MAIIENGGSHSRKAIVNANSQLLVKSTSEPAEITAAKTSDAYIAYGDVTFTVDTESDLIYIKNTDTDFGGRNLIITSFDMYLGSSTGGSGDATLTFYKNPTTFPTAVDAIVSNSNFADTKQVSLDAKKGNGSTKTLGAAGIELPIQINNQPVYRFDSTTIIPKNKSIGFSFTPPSGNTSQKVNFIISFYMESASVDKG